MLSRHSVGTYQGNELTLNLWQNASFQLSQLAELLWTDSGQKSGSGVHELISMLKSKCSRGMIHPTSPKNPCMWGKRHHHHPLKAHAMVESLECTWKLLNPACSLSSELMLVQVCWYHLFWGLINKLSFTKDCWTFRLKFSGNVPMSIGLHLHIQRSHWEDIHRRARPGSTRSHQRGETHHCQLSFLVALFLSETRAAKVNLQRICYMICLHRPMM